ncbi:trypsin 5G1-like [Haematobia irritans]|uniref:trypsin 5G1-like n=1 Tax=Haematobia irritans TaxID=7368 RepID=UPI003F507695
MYSFISFAVLFAAGCSAASVHLPRLDGRIVGGYETDIKEVPFQVSLQNGWHYCGGSLIAKRFVLTAAHCTDRDPEHNPNFSIRIGSSYSRNGGLLVKPIRIHQHWDYNNINVDYDFSIVELEDYDESVLPFELTYAKLPKAKDVVAEGTLLTVSGWGNTKDPQESRDVLRAVQVPKVTNDVCEQAYSGIGVITERMLCAGYPQGGKDACQGDSGGPMSIDGVLVGVVSWGYGCAEPNYPGVYARVSSILPWIANTTGLDL